ncbi:MAG: ribosomal protein L11 methyltransferase [bacterium]|jgi:ribosomal protein L11 methyltransferase
MKTSNHYNEAIFACNTEQFELISYYFFEHDALGVEETKTDLEKTVFKVYFDQIKKEEIEKIIQLIQSEIDIKNSNLEFLEFDKKENKNWQSEWKKNFHPIEIGETLIILPPWEKEKLCTPRKAIVINPGQGFGTGYHESTQLALEALEWVALHKEEALNQIVDVGIGSGILSIAALQFGAKSIQGVDLEHEAVLEVPQNIEHSGLSTDNVVLKTGSLRDFPEMKGSLVVANIIAEILIDLQKELISSLQPGGYLLLSGIIDEYREEVANQFSHQLALKKSFVKGEWHAMVFRKPIAVSID